MKTTRAVALIVMFALGLACNYVAAQDPAVTDEDIVVSSFEEMRYPGMARLARISSVVVVRVKLDDTGKVVSATAVSGAKLILPDVVDNVKKWRFHPNADKSAVVVYRFEIVEGRCDPPRNGIFVFRPPNTALVMGCNDVWQP